MLTCTDRADSHGKRIGPARQYTCTPPESSLDGGGLAAKRFSSATGISNLYIARKSESMGTKANGSTGKIELGLVLFEKLGKLMISQSKRAETFSAIDVGCEQLVQAQIECKIIHIGNKAVRVASPAANAPRTAMNNVFCRAMR